MKLFSASVSLVGLVILVVSLGMLQRREITRLRAVVLSQQQIITRQENLAKESPFLPLCDDSQVGQSAFVRFNMVELGVVKCGADHAWRNLEEINHGK